jgi:hypothetical protein
MRRIASGTPRHSIRAWPIVAVLAVAAGGVVALVVVRNAGAAPSCRSADLEARAGLQGATGSLLGGVLVTNRGGLRCTLPKVPHVSLVWNGRTLAVKQVQFPQRWLDSQWAWRGTTPIRVLHPRQSAFVVLQWHNWCGARPFYSRQDVELRLPGQAKNVVAHLEDTARPRCDVSSASSTLRVSPFLPPP